jgi:hypothetical protein
VTRGAVDVGASLSGVAASQLELREQRQRDRGPVTVTTPLEQVDRPDEQALCVVQTTLQQPAIPQHGDGGRRVEHRRGSGCGTGQQLLPLLATVVHQRIPPGEERRRDVLADIAGLGRESESVTQDVHPRAVVGHRQREPPLREQPTGQPIVLSGANEVQAGVSCRELRGVVPLHLAEPATRELRLRTHLR